MALASELNGTGVEFVGDDLGVGGGIVELDGGSAAAIEVIVLECKRGRRAGGMDSGAAKVHEGAGGDLTVFDVCDSDAGSGVILEEAAVDFDGGGRVFFGGAGDGDEGCLGEGVANGGEGDLGDFEIGRIAFDLDERKGFGGVFDGLKEGVFGINSDETEFGGVLEDERGVEGVSARGEDDLATSSGEGIIDELLQIGAGESLGVECAGEEAGEEEEAHLVVSGEKSVAELGGGGEGF